MESTAVIEKLWDRIQARDWRAVSDLLDEGIVVEWPVSAERIEGRANFVAVNSRYPEGWTIRVLRVVAEGDEVVSEVEVPHQTNGVFRAASFWTVRDGRLSAAGSIGRVLVRIHRPNGALVTSSGSDH